MKFQSIHLFQPSFHFQLESLVPQNLIRYAQNKKFILCILRPPRVCVYIHAHSYRLQCVRKCVRPVYHQTTQSLCIYTCITYRFQCVPQQVYRGQRTAMSQFYHVDSGDPTQVVRQKISIFRLSPNVIHELHSCHFFNL